MSSETLTCPRCGGKEFENIEIVEVPGVQPLDRDEVRVEYLLSCGYRPRVTALRYELRCIGTVYRPIQNAPGDIGEQVRCSFVIGGKP